MRYSEFAGKSQGGDGSAKLVANFDYNSAPFLSLLGLDENDYILEIVIKVINVFDSGFDMSLGFPANHSEIAPSSKISLQREGSYKFFPYRKSSISETLTAFFSGTSTKGNGTIFVF